MRAERALTLSLFLALGGLSAQAPGQPAGAASPTIAPQPSPLSTRKLPAASNAANILPVEQAFRFSAAALTTTQATLEWQIQSGYYLYQQKLSVIDADGRKITLKLPPATPLKDEFEGESQVYFTLLTLTVPLGTPTADGKHHFQVQFQGCAQDRYCYPPVSREIALEPAR